MFGLKLPTPTHVWQRDDIIIYHVKCKICGYKLHVMKINGYNDFTRSYKSIKSILCPLGGCQAT